MKYVLGLGSNLGHKEENIAKAIERINQRLGEVKEILSMMKSAPVGFSSENEFINCCLIIDTSLKPLQLLKELKRIEKDLGRIYTKNGYQDRIIDIDILIGEQKVCTKNLKVPHPLYVKRDFVLIPLSELSCFLDSKTFLRTSQLAL